MSTIVKKLGVGQSGVVYLIRNRDGKLFVWKQIEVKTEKIKKMVGREKNILKRIKSRCTPYLVCAVEFYHRKNVVNLIFRYIPGSYELEQLIRKNNEFTVYMKYIIAERLMLGLLQLHRMKIVHRDIKPGNIMLNPKTLAPVYIDFGFACTAEEKVCYRKVAGTPNYLPPEVLKSSRMASFEQVKKSDVFSLGITILYFFTKQKPWEAKKSAKWLFREIKSMSQGKMDFMLERIARNVPSGGFLTSMVAPMLRIDWRERVSIEGALKHLYQGADILMRERGRHLGLTLEEISDEARREAAGFVLAKGTKIMGTEANPLNRTI